VKHENNAGGRPALITRREVLALLGGGAVAWPLRAFAQPAPGLPLVAVLWPGTPESVKDSDAALRGGLKDGGSVEGTNFAFAMRYANGEDERLAPLAAELAALKPRVIMMPTDAAALAVHNAAPTVPLVFTALFSDPVALGLAESYAQPGGMATGFTNSSGGGEEALVGKRISLLKELVPGLARVGVIGVADSPSFAIAQNGTKTAAGHLGLDVFPLPVRTIEDVEAAFASGLRAGAGAFYIDAPPLLFSNRAKVAEFAARAGKPTIAPTTVQARAGLLMSYAPDLAEEWRLAGGYAVKILAGAKPADLPIQQPDKFTFVINLKTAQALGITIPSRLLLLADETIE
jgi:putative ABC transport system substrate-binding protein